MCLWDGIILSRIQSKTCIAVTCFITVLMTCVISALAFSADAAQYTSVDMIQPYAATVTGSASSDDESEILSSQDWEALLNVSSEESEPVSSEATDTLLGSPLKNGISGDSFFLLWYVVSLQRRRMPWQRNAPTAKATSEREKTVDGRAGIPPGMIRRPARPSTRTS